eukprot:439946-Rhodomonas_salina.8
MPIAAALVLGATYAISVPDSAADRERQGHFELRGTTIATVSTGHTLPAYAVPRPTSLRSTTPYQSTQYHSLPAYVHLLDVDEKRTQPLRELVPAYARSVPGLAYQIRRSSLADFTSRSSRHEPPFQPVWYPRSARVSTGHSVGDSAFRSSSI